jgi:NADPH-dependent curcumin reductase CurA
VSEGGQAWLLARTPPGGLPEPADFAWVERDLPVPAEGQALVRTLYLSLDPYQWGRRRRGIERPGEVCHGRTVSQVLESRMPGFAAGDFVFNTSGWQTHGLVGRDQPVFGYMHPRRLDPAVAPLTTAVGVLGMLGLTAYAGLLVQCVPRRGETVVVSAAAGGVGQIVGQLAKIEGCRVVGIAGSPEKCAFVTDELGFDACLSHREPGLVERLAAACPDGIDVYFENVGGAVFEAVLPNLASGARICLCGLISQYGSSDEDPAAVWQATGAAVFERRRVAVHRLFVGDFVDTHQDRFLGRMAEWLRDGRVRYREDIRRGLEQAPAVFRALLTGGSFGKTLIAVAPDPTQP